MLKNNVYYYLIIPRPILDIDADIDVDPDADIDGDVNVDDEADIDNKISTTFC